MIDNKRNTKKCDIRCLAGHIKSKHSCRECIGSTQHLTCVTFLCVRAIKYSLYYLTWRSLCSSGLVMISFTITIHPYVSHTYKNSISRRYSQNWWAAKVVSSHFSAYIESIYYVMREASSLQYYQTSCQPERIAPHIVLTEKTLHFKEGIWQTFFSSL